MAKPAIKIVLLSVTAAILVLADHTNGHAYVIVLRLSSLSVCDVMYCG